MAELVPFRALRYQPAKVPSLAPVVTPPYDVITPEQQEAFYQAHPYNIIRIELGKRLPTDNERDNCYTRAAGYLKSWIAEGVMGRDQDPAFYLCETTFVDPTGTTHTRRGFFGLLKVEDFEAGVVLPHERTFTSHKRDRFQLTVHTSANVSPIFALYPDGDNDVWQVLASAREPEPIADFVDPLGLHQRMYMVRDPQACRKVARLMATKHIFIADGHHRYETAIAYRDYMRARHPHAPEDAPFNYVLVYLCSMSDPGLTILACHRLLPHLNGFSSSDFLAKAREFFDIHPMDPTGDPLRDSQLLTEALARHGNGAPTIALASADTQRLFMLKLKPGVMDREEGEDVQGPLKELDVVVLTRVVLERILGLDNEARDKEHTIRYMADTPKVLTQVRRGQAAVAFLLNPTRVEQVRAVAEARLIMPRKATYFYPKVLTGLVLNPIDPSERLGRWADGG